MELCSMIQFVAELQQLLRLHRSIVDWQALLRFSRVKFLPGSEGKESSLCQLHSLLSSCFCCRSSLLL